MSREDTLGTCALGASQLSTQWVPVGLWWPSLWVLGREAFARASSPRQGLGGRARPMCSLPGSLVLGLRRQKRPELAGGEDLGRLAGTHWREVEVEAGLGETCRDVKVAMR